MKTEWWWLSTLRMTVIVRVEDGKIAEAPPIVRKFLGQSLNNLVVWMRHQPEFIATRVADPGPTI